MTTRFLHYNILRHDLPVEKFHDAKYRAIQDAVRTAQINLTYGNLYTSNVYNCTAFTVAEILDENGNVEMRGYAFCAETDNFCKAIGRQIAEGRALKRRLFWACANK